MTLQIKYHFYPITLEILSIINKMSDEFYNDYVDDYCNGGGGAYNI